MKNYILSAQDIIKMAGFENTELAPTSEIKEIVNFLPVGQITSTVLSLLAKKSLDSITDNDEWIGEHFILKELAKCFKQVRFFFNLDLTTVKTLTKTFETSKCWCIDKFTYDEFCNICRRINKVSDEQFQVIVEEITLEALTDWPTGTYVVPIARDEETKEMITITPDLYDKYNLKDCAYVETFRRNPSDYITDDELDIFVDKFCIANKVFKKKALSAKSFLQEEAALAEAGTRVNNNFGLGGFTFNIAGCNEIKEADKVFNINDLVYSIKEESQLIEKKSASSGKEDYERFLITLASANEFVVKYVKEDAIKACGIDEEIYSEMETVTAEIKQEYQEAIAKSLGDSDEDINFSTFLSQISSRVYLPLQTTKIWNTILDMLDGEPFRYKPFKIQDITDNRLRSILRKCEY